jgi:RNA polymerase sigma factor (sigma-70 family)
MADDADLESLAREAVAGNRDALDELVRSVHGDVYGLAIRMLWNREDAEDATQEILVRVVTRLSQFDFRSRLKTWVYRIGVNYILDVKKSPIDFYSIRSERLRMEQLDYNILFRWFVGLEMDEP